MKTEQLKEFYESLSELNNGFTHYTFVWNQFNIDYLVIIESEPETQTNDYFLENPYKRKHNIKFKELENEHTKTNTTLVNGIYVLIYAHFESYLKNMLDFARTIDSSILTLEEKSDSFEDDSVVVDKVLNRIGTSKTELENELFDTLDYLRLKRNKLIHSNSNNISGTITELIKSKGNQLNDFWNEHLPSSLQGIDFTDKENFTEITFSIVIDTINTLRKIALEINDIIIKSLSKESIINKVVILEFQNIHKGKINGLKIERKVSKFRAFCKSEFGMELDDNDIGIYKSSIA
ncbi:hypothetical protein BWZ20_00515 [Winogradskyella sp. J14-2]|uniref:hypothetical protein n=1 Tax=Winogradskyella sp. J14-2 TaxID=1936080 RepID=UPI00097285C4|nr:hypothetical protein [Winogradskyella sp. J14-2]APY06869.1 hypothetical protein BWZ20_00515 [Winogradskyella sp. J14-2]